MDDDAFPFVYRDRISGREYVLHRKFVQLKNQKSRIPHVIFFFVARGNFPRGGEPTSLPRGWEVVPSRTRQETRRRRQTDGTSAREINPTNRYPRLPFLRKTDGRPPRVAPKKKPKPRAKWRTMYTRCGKPTCGTCSGSGRHGPYRYRYKRVKKNGKIKKKHIRKAIRKAKKPFVFGDPFRRA